MLVNESTQYIFPLPKHSPLVHRFDRDRPTEIEKGSSELFLKSIQSLPQGYVNNVTPRNPISQCQYFHLCNEIIRREHRIIKDIVSFLIFKRKYFDNEMKKNLPLKNPNSLNDIHSFQLTSLVGSIPSEVIYNSGGEWKKTT